MILGQVSGIASSTSTRRLRMTVTRVMNGLATRSMLAVTRLPSASTSPVLPGVQTVLGGQLRRSGDTPHSVLDEAA
jgi:hypothetical protein